MLKFHNLPILAARGWSSLRVSPGLGLNQGEEQELQTEAEQQEAGGGGNHQAGGWRKRLKIEDLRSFFSLCKHNTILSCLTAFTKKSRKDREREEKRRSLVVVLSGLGPPPAHDSLQMKCHPGRQ